MTIYRLNRNVSIEECSWLPRDLIKSDVVHRFSGVTYGCVSPIGVACTFRVEGDGEFFEVPREALDVV